MWFPDLNTSEREFTDSLAQEFPHHEYPAEVPLGRHLLRGWDQYGGDSLEKQFAVAPSGEVYDLERISSVLRNLTMGDPRQIEARDAWELMMANQICVYDYWGGY